MRKIEGVVTGIVKEIDAGGARLKLAFPWLEASYKSHWAPIAAPMSDRKSTRLNSSHIQKSRMPSSA